MSDEDRRARARYEIERFAGNFDGVSGAAWRAIERSTGAGPLEELLLRALIDETRGRIVCCARDLLSAPSSPDLLEKLKLELELLDDLHDDEERFFHGDPA